MSKESIVEKSKLQQYLEYAPTQVNILKLVEWLEVQGNGVFKISRPMKKIKNGF